MRCNQDVGAGCSRRIVASLGPPLTYALAFALLTPRVIRLIEREYRRLPKVLRSSAATSECALLPAVLARRLRSFSSLLRPFEPTRVVAILTPHSTSAVASAWNASVAEDCRPKAVIQAAKALSFHRRSACYTERGTAHVVLALLLATSACSAPRFETVRSDPVTTRRCPRLERSRRQRPAVVYDSAGTDPLQDHQNYVLKLRILALTKEAWVPEVRQT